MLYKIAGLALIFISAGVASPIAPQGFSLTGVNRFVTPNGDKRNDAAFFRYDNSQDTSGTIRIYELYGRQVATIVIEPGCISGCTASWDPRGYADGVYIYVLTIDQASRSGVLVVVR